MLPVVAVAGAVIGIFRPAGAPALGKNLEVLQARNFYGPLEVRDDLPTEDYAQRTLLHGTIDHGSQKLLDPGCCAMAVTTSCSHTTPSALASSRAMNERCRRGVRIRAGVIGLGAPGVLSNYGRKGDYFRIYEINPADRAHRANIVHFLGPHSACGQGHSHGRRAPDAGAATRE